MESNTTLLTPQVLVRFKLYTDSNRTAARSIGAPVWMDAQTVFGPGFDYGSAHEFTFLEQGGQPSRYMVAMPPFVRTIDRPGHCNDLDILVTIYLAPATHWPLFEPLSSAMLTGAMLPR